MPSYKLSDCIRGIAAKRLLAVETDPHTSHQHEFHGVAAFKQLLGLCKRELVARHLFLADDEQSNVAVANRPSMLAR